MKNLILIFGLISSSVTFAKSDDASLPFLMHSFYTTLFELRPYMNSEEEFKDPKNRDKIKALLKILENRVDDNQVKKLSKAPGFATTYGLLGSHIRETSYLYEHEVYGVAHNNLKATTGLCIMCHERLPKPASPEAHKKGLVIKDVEDLTDAEFYYIAHEFDRALSVYDTLVRKYDGSQADFDFDQVYRRKIAYFARILRDPNAAVANLKLDLANPKLPKSVRKNLNGWVKYFKSWSQEGSKDPSQLSDEKFLAFAKSEIEKNTEGRKISISDTSNIKLLRVSGQLYERVFKKPSSSYTPEMLYLLAKCERDLAPIQKYSLADIYLRECVIEYPKAPIAKTCFSDYEVSMKQKANFDSKFIKENIETLRVLLNP
ncbi:MAG: hypothetical protein IPM97_07670 [Bdellovibrionaceae bacterium]|nr:hypothetical protein [Pseudobdellovibrionaceae bacterium]